MKRVLILMGRYLPGHKDGGPLRTVINLTEALGDEYEFRIAALDRDHGDEKRYPHIQLSAWSNVGKAKVWYVSPGKFSFRLIRRLTKDVDLIYVCGFYDDYGYKTLVLNRVGLIWHKPVVVASMGTFSMGALSQKSTKKKIFICLCKIMGLFRKIKWSVTSPMEEAEVRRKIGNDAICIIAEDLPRSCIRGKVAPPSPKGMLNIVFLSRICPQKNLLAVAKILQKVIDTVVLSVYGPQEDMAYWEVCKAELEKLPPNIKWSYCGEIPSEDVPEIFAQHDVFLFPTLGENYGHVIFEALSAGCIPVISDQTPWNEIESQGAGFVCPLKDEHGFVESIHQLVQMPAENKQLLSNRAVEIAWQKISRSKTDNGYRKIFD